jgi:ectoine hydroxylase-related dioxygenase (phytanoyl-CoA dioxygenase family)
MDSVFMNRGTKRVLTAWVPLGDIDLTLSGLAILEHAHRLEHLIATYGAEDVDKYCSNRPGAEEAQKKETLLWNGALSDDPMSLREEYGRRWLTAEFRAGDVVLFTMNTIHMGLDNNSERIRLSVDCRYQPAADPADPRWIGENPSAHGARSKVGIIC